MLLHWGNSGSEGTNAGGNTTVEKNYGNDNKVNTGTSKIPVSNENKYNVDSVITRTENIIYALLIFTISLQILYTVLLKGYLFSILAKIFLYSKDLNFNLFDQCMFVFILLVTMVFYYSLKFLMEPLRTKFFEISVRNGYDLETLVIVIFVILCIYHFGLPTKEVPTSELEIVDKNIFKFFSLLPLLPSKESIPEVKPKRSRSSNVNNNKNSTTSYVDWQFASRIFFAILGIIGFFVFWAIKSVVMAKAAEMAGVQPTGLQQIGNAISNGFSSLWGNSEVVANMHTKGVDQNAQAIINALDKNIIGLKEEILELRKDMVNNNSGKSNIWWTIGLTVLNSAFGFVLYQSYGFLWTKFIVGKPATGLGSQVEHGNVALHGGLKTELDLLSDNDKVILEAAKVAASSSISVSESVDIISAFLLQLDPAKYELARAFVAEAKRQAMEEAGLNFPGEQNINVDNAQLEEMQIAIPVNEINDELKQQEPEVQRRGFGSSWKAILAAPFTRLFKNPEPESPLQVALLNNIQCNNNQISREILNSINDDFKNRATIRLNEDFNPIILNRSGDIIDFINNPERKEIILAKNMEIVNNMEVYKQKNYTEPSWFTKQIINLYKEHPKMGKALITVGTSSALGLTLQGVKYTFGFMGIDVNVPTMAKFFFSGTATTVSLITGPINAAYNNAMVIYRNPSIVRAEVIQQNYDNNRLLEYQD